MKKFMLVCSFALICVLGFSACGKVSAGTIARVERPTIVSSFVYDGTKKNPLPGLDTKVFNVAGETSATVAGTYSCIVSLKDTTKHTWVDGSIYSIMFNWSITPRLDAISVLKEPSVTVVPGKDVVYNLGSVKMDWSDGINEHGFSTTEDCKSDWVTFDLSAVKYNENYGRNIYGTYKISYGNMPPIESFLHLPKTVVVSTSAELIAALGSPTAELVLINKGTYNIDNTIVHDAAYVKTKKVIIGTEDTVVNVKGTLSENAIIIFQDSVTLKNIKFVCEGDQNAIKVSNLPDPSQLIEDVYFENITISGAKGLNLHGVETAVLKNITVNVEDTTSCVALNLRQATTVALSGSTITNGTWGSVGLMYGTGDKPSTLIIKEGNTFTSNLYIEDYEASGSLILNFDWDYTTSGTTKIYVNPVLVEDQTIISDTSSNRAVVSQTHKDRVNVDITLTAATVLKSIKIELIDASGEVAATLVADNTNTLWSTAIKKFSAPIRLTADLGTDSYWIQTGDLTETNPAVTAKVTVITTFNKTQTIELTIINDWSTLDFPTE